MKAMVLNAAKTPLVEKEIPLPRPAPGQLLIQVKACAVCRTDLHIIDGELASPKLPLVPGHEIVGRVAEAGEGVTHFRKGDRVGVPWLGWTCGECSYCRSGRENLCDRAKFTGYQIDGGYAESTVADERFVFSIPEAFSDEKAAPLLCAGLIGYRSLKMAQDAEKLGIYGFGAAAHLIAQVAQYQGRKVYAFTRPGDLEAQKFATELGAVWAGDTNHKAPVALDAALVFAPVGGLVPKALQDLAKGGTVVCGGIHMSDIPSFPYESLWGERVIRSVANLTRKDGEEFLDLAAKVPVRTLTESFPLEKAQAALEKLKKGLLRGAAVLVPGSGPQ